MKLQKIIMAAAIGMPCVVQAAQVEGEKLEIYGKIHVSINSADIDDPAVTTKDGMSISSNSSRFGFKGKLPTESDIDVIWQMEQEVALDDHSAGSFTNRNSFIGLGSGEHRLVVGIHDTPFKSVASNWGVFGDSVAERRSILGASYNKGNQLNERVKNMMMYQFKNKTTKIQAMYAIDPEAGSPGVTDDNTAKMSGIGAWFNVSGIKLSFGWEDWKNHSVIVDGNAYRVAASYDAGAHTFGVIFENIDTDAVTATANALAFKRSASGVNWKWKFSDKADFRAQYLVANSADNTTDTGANKLGLGVFYSLEKKAKVYFAYAKTSNDANAKFQAVDGGHGDEVKTVNGGVPSAMSVGMEFKF